MQAEDCDTPSKNLPCMPYPCSFTHAAVELTSLTCNNF